MELRFGCLMLEITTAQVEKRKRAHAQRASDWLVVPLCSACHTGQHGVHGDKAMMRIAKMGELDMLADTLAKVYG